MKFISRLMLFAVTTCLLVFAPLTAAYADSEQQGDIVRMSGDIYVNEDTTVNGNVVTLNGDIYVNGIVSGDVVAVFGDIMVNNGKVMGDAVTVTGKITTGENGRIMGDSVQALGGAFRNNRDYKYEYKYEYDYTPRINIPSSGIRITGIISSFVFTLVMFGVACLVYLILNNKIEKMAATLEPNLGKRIGIGFLTLIGSPIAMILLSIILAITILGIIAIPFVWIAYLLLIFTAIVPVYVYIGRKTGRLMSKQSLSGYGAIAIGMLVMWVINTILSLGGIYTGWINVILSIAFFVLGTGTFLDFLFTNRKRKPISGQYNPSYHQGDGAGYQYTQDMSAEDAGVNKDNNIPKDDNK